MIGRMSRKRRRLPRRGFTLLEIIIAATGVAIMLGLVAVTLQMLMRLNGASQTRLASAITFERLARQLREDVRGAGDALITPPGPPDGKPAGLRLTCQPEHLIAYEVRDASIVRIESLAGKPIRHESYNLLGGRTGRFELRDESAAKLVCLVVVRSPGASRTDPPRPLEVVALVGKDRPGLLGKEGGARR